MKSRFKFSQTRLLVLLVLLISAISLAQFPIKLPKISVGSPFEKEPPLTTNLKDAVTEIPFLDSFDPADAKPLSLFERGPNGGFLIQSPGAYWLSAQSYCFHAGTHSPGKGNGYLYAPLKGQKADMIRNVLRRSVGFPNIPQHNVQTLIWAILAQTKPSKMNEELESTSKMLLTKNEISDLEGSAFSEISQELFNSSLIKLPPETRRIFDAERQLRNAVSGNVSYGELERIAVLTGEPLPGKGDRNIPSGRWSYHTDGYFIRYFPDGYQTTRMEVYFPENLMVERDTSNRISGISDRSGRRLVIQYDDSIPALLVNKENSLKGFAFNSVKIEYKLPGYQKIKYKKDLGTATMAEWNNVGWTFFGSLDGKGKVASTDNRFMAASERYENAKRQRDELNSFFKNIATLERFKKMSRISVEETQNLVELMQLSSAMSSLLAANGIDPENIFLDPIEFTQRAWAMRLTEVLRSHQTSVSMIPANETPNPFFGRISFFSSPLVEYGMPEFNSENGAAAPANTGRQRLGISDRPTDRDQKCKDEFRDCENEAGSAYTECFAACGSAMPSSPTLGDLNRARKCFSSCESNYSQQNRQCSRAAKKCTR